MWQSRPVFISSTFVDMQAERDHLRNQVFPELEERAKSRRRHLEWVDLRVGVATAELDADARELQVLKVCLAEVKRCKPFLIVLLGDRYGTVASAERVRAATVEQGFDADVLGRSVTDLEIRYGVLFNRDQQARSFFYFREPLPYSSMPRDVAALYSDEHTGGSDAQDRATKLAALKHEIAQILPDRVRRYTVGWDDKRKTVTGLEAWGRTVLEDIWSEILAVTPANEAEEHVSWQQAERAALDDYIEDHAQDFIGREDVLARVASVASSPAQEGTIWGICVTGPSGAGKSAIFAEAKRRFARGEAFLLAHSAGASARAPSLEDMLRRWIEELGTALAVNPGLEERADPDTIESTFRSLLTNMAARRRVVVLIDALDQFEDTSRARFLSWLPLTWPINARLVATGIFGDAVKALQARAGVEMLGLRPLAASEARAIAQSICQRYHRTLEPKVLDTLLTKGRKGDPAAGNTLWLVLAVEELNLLDADDFARARRSHKGAPAEQLLALMLDKLAQLPADVPGLYAASFRRAAELFGHGLTLAFLGVVAISRSGWRETDLRDLMPKLSRSRGESRRGILHRLFGSSTPQPIMEEPWDELRVASLRRIFRGQMRRRGAFGQWDFNHAQMRVAVRHWLMAQRVSESEFHAEIATHLLSLPANDPLRQSETMVHLLGSQDWTRAANYYGDQSLSEAESRAATRVLADTIVLRRAVARDARLDQALRLLDASAHPQIRWMLSERFMLELDKTLTVQAELADRLSLMQAVRDTLVHLLLIDPNNLQWQRSLFGSHMTIGDIMLAQGDLSKALTYFNDGRAIAEQLARSDPHNVDWQRDLSVAFERTGRAQGNVDDGLRWYVETREIILRLIEADPDNINFRHDLGIIHERMGDAYLIQGDLPAAFRAYEVKLQIARIISDLTRQEPDNTVWQRDEAVAYEKVGNVLTEAGDLPKAADLLEESLKIRTRLVAMDPTNAAWQRDFSVSQDKMGDVLLSQGKIPEAVALYRDSLAITDDLSRGDPANGDLQLDLSTSHTKMGEALIAYREQRHAAEAMEAFREGLAIAARFAKIYKNNAAWQRQWARCLSGVGEAMIGLARDVEALDYFAQALVVFGRLVTADTGNEEWRHGLAMLHVRIVDVLINRREFPKALVHCRAGEHIMSRLVQKHPKNARWQRGLSIVYDRLAEALVAQRDLKGAAQASRSSLALSEAVAGSAPTNSAWQFDIATSHEHLGRLLTQIGSYAEALIALKRGRAIVAPLAAIAEPSHPSVRLLENFDLEIAELEARLRER